MGFWDTAGKIASGAAKVVKDASNEINEYVSEYEGKSDDFLKNKTQSGSTAQRMAASKVLAARRR
jgi:hypothetical protein